MNGDEASGDGEPEETTVRLRTGLKSCRALLDDYRAMLLDGRHVVGDARSAEPVPPKVDDPV